VGDRADGVVPGPAPGLLCRLKTLIQEYGQIQSEGTMDTLRRFRMLVMVAVPLHVGLGVFFGQFKAPEGRLDIQAWADALTFWQLGLATVLLILGVSTHFYSARRTVANWLGITLQTAICLAYLTFGVACSYLDLRIGNGIVTFLIICLAIGTISLMRPLMSFGIFVSTALVFWTILHRISIDPTLLASIKVQVVAMLVMTMCLSMVLWHQYTRNVLLRRQLSDSNAILKVQQEELVTLAERDSLTGLYNRRQFMRMAEMELVRADRMPRGTSLLMVDLDFFKKVNDQHGHPAGDGVLQQVAGILINSVRASDLVGRMGGEEFIVLLPYTTPDQAVLVAENLRQALRAHPLKIELLELPVTASFGVTGLTETQKAPLQALYAAADTALYKAKHAGRDRVEAIPPEHTPRPTFS
jgi:diguanylate cyclase (GGDEF)-like protein